MFTHQPRQKLQEIGYLPSVPCTMYGMELRCARDPVPLLKQCYGDDVMESVHCVDHLQRTHLVLKLDNPAALPVPPVPPPGWEEPSCELPPAPEKARKCDLSHVHQLWLSAGCW